MRLMLTVLADNPALEHSMSQLHPLVDLLPFRAQAGPAMAIWVRMVSPAGSASGDPSTSQRWIWRPLSTTIRHRLEHRAGGPGRLPQGGAQHRAPEPDRAGQIGTGDPGEGNAGVHGTVRGAHLSLGDGDPGGGAPRRGGVPARTGPVPPREHRGISR